MQAVFGSLARYQRSWLQGDLVAGLTVWAVLVPEALAYAAIAGVSPVVGLYAAPGALLLYAAFGSSRHLIVGPMAATAALSAAAAAQVATQGSGGFVAATAALAIMTGVIALLAGILRLGFLANFISEPVLKGFIVGLALTIIVGQLPKLFGYEKGSGNFFEQAWHFIAHLGDTSGINLLLGVASLAVVLGLRRFAPMIPGSLVAVLLGIAAVHLFSLVSHGVDVVGPIKSGLPRLGLPHVPAKDYLTVAGSAVGIMLVGFAEGLGAAKTYAAKNGYQVDANRELLGLGAANAAAGLSSGMVVNGSLSKTAVNGSAGAKSQMSGLVVAVLTVVTLLFMTGLFEDLPEATLAAIVIAALIELVDFATLRAYYRIYTGRLGLIYGPATRADFIAAVAAMLGVLIFDTLPGLFIGIAVSILLAVYRSSRPNVAVLGLVPGTRGQWADVARHPENATTPGIVVLRVESGLYFGNADHVRASIDAAAADSVRAIILDCESVPSVDATSTKMLGELAARLASRDVKLLLARDLGQVRDVLSATEEGSSITVYPTVRAAIDALTQGSGQ